MPIEHILFDADGVVQYPTVRWGTALASALGLADQAHVQQVLLDILQAEAACLEVPDGFEASLAATLARWDRAGSVQVTLDALLAIEVDADVMGIVQALRRGGIRCHVASNQQATRARHMSQVLGYGTLFDSEFYSCFLGAAKPGAAFFERALAALGCSGSAVLFLDDLPENVDAARRAGLSASLFRGADGARSLQQKLAAFGLSVQP